MIQLTYKLCDFKTPDSNRGMLVDRDSMIELIESEETKQKIRDRVLYGAITHAVRDQFLDKTWKSVGSHSDFLMTSPFLCNVLTDLRLESDSDGDEIIVGDLLIYDNPAGKTIQMLIGTGTKMQVSMSVYSQIRNGLWHFKKICGVDFTANGALSTELLNVVKDISV